MIIMLTLILNFSVENYFVKGNFLQMIPKTVRIFLETTKIKDCFE